MRRRRSILYWVVGLLLQGALSSVFADHAKNYRECFISLLSLSHRAPALERYLMPGVDPNASRVKWLMKHQGLSLVDALSRINVPYELRKLFNPDGSFNVPGPKLKLLSENGDRQYSNLRMNWSSHLDQQAISRELLFNLVEALRATPSLQLTIIVNGAHESVVSSEISKLSEDVNRRIHMLVVPNIIPIELWARDGSKPLQNAQGEKKTTVMPRASADDMHQQRYMWAVAASSAVTKTDIVSTPLAFRGGDIVVGARHVFVGFRTIERNAAELGISFNEVVDAFKQQFDTDVVAMRGADFDLDLSIAIVRDKKRGDEVALLASPRETIKIFIEHLSKISNEDVILSFKKILSGEETGSLMDVATKLNLDLTLGEKDLLHFIDQLAKNGFTQHQFEERVATLEAQKMQLESLGYRVVEIPDFGLVKASSTSLHRSARTSDDALEQAFARSANNTPGAFSYANSVFSRDFALIPATGIRMLDRRYGEIVSKLGYRTFGVTAVQRSMCLSGGARCLLEAD